ncbi:hypothetical protein Q3G72_016382 [Acer saccharum]|nr:hypothetical protein Q3G72_016382 [Acer saccharum]
MRINLSGLMCGFFHLHRRYGVEPSTGIVSNVEELLEHGIAHSAGKSLGTLIPRVLGAIIQFIVSGAPSPASLSGSKHAKPTPVAYQYWDFSPLPSSSKAFQSSGSKGPEHQVKAYPRLGPSLRIGLD